MHAAPRYEFIIRRIMPELRAQLRRVKLAIAILEAQCSRERG